jgi:FkbM family methyltransferase
LYRSPAARSLRLNIEMVRPLFMGRRRRASVGWSEYGEDERLARELSGSLIDGYYVDIGANHPARGSNSYRLYNLGMRGVCVEPNDELCNAIRRFRPGDVVLNAAIGAENGLAKFYELSYHGISTFSEEEAVRRQAAGAKLLRISFKPMLRLATILEQCVPPGRSKLELLSVDTEGLDEMVLRSNDWSRFRPRFVLVEANTDDAAIRLRGLMESVGYESIDAFGVNSLFRDLRQDR